MHRGNGPRGPLQLVLRGTRGAGSVDHGTHERVDAGGLDRLVLLGGECLVPVLQLLDLVLEVLLGGGGGGLLGLNLLRGQWAGRSRGGAGCEGVRLGWRPLGPPRERRWLVTALAMQFP